MTRRALARDWAVAVSATAYLPMTVAEVEERLLGLLTSIVDRMAAGDEAASFDAAQAAGVDLVAMHCTGPHSLRRCVEVLAAGLPALPDLAEADIDQTAVVSVLGALTGGYADALRRKTFQQQEDIKKALAGVLRLSEARFREVFTGSAIGIAISDLDGTTVQTNRALGEILGYEDTELTTRNLRDFIGDAAGDDGLWTAYRSTLGGGPDKFRIQRPLMRKDGEQIWVYLAVSLLRDEHGAPSHHVTMVEDITDLHLLQVQLNNQALNDVLTGLPNRQSFGLRLESTLGQLDPDALVTLFHLDIDSFSVINDGLGHDVGDQLLRMVAQRLRDVFEHEQATIARIASDEFAVLVENTPSTPSMATLAARINEELSEPTYLDSIGLAVSAGIGVVQRQAGGITPAELLRQSDSTLRRAKGNGKRQWAVFDRHQDRLDRDRFTLAAGMPGALENGEFQVVYRPLVQLSDGGLVAVEALVSWNHPECGLLDHESVVPLSEQTGMVLPIGQWLLRTACQQAAAWAEGFGARRGAPRPVVINLPTAVANDPDLLAMVNGVLDETGLEPELLRLGLPVRALLCEEGEAEENLQLLADKGVGTSIHGFGGGHGGLVFLEDLPVQSVWIAGWLVDRLAERPDSVTGRALHDLISLVHTFDATVITAGVRTGEQADWWRGAGGDVACGDWFAAPGPAAAITERLRD